MEKKRKKEEIVSEMLKWVAPGTPIREGIENVLRAKTGGLIVVGYSEQMKSIVDGGFEIQAKCTPASLYELAKMDGGIILNEKGSEILYANVQLMPDVQVSSRETGMRHRTAERVAKQTGHLVIAISERRNVITLYKGNIRYVLKDIAVILAKANQALQTLDKYKMVLDQGITNLGALEFENVSTLSEAVQVFHRVEMVLRIKTEILNYINELGTEGRLIQLQLTELVSNIELEAKLLIQDYLYAPEADVSEILKKLQKRSTQELLEDGDIAKILGYPSQTKMDQVVIPKGYRILHKIPRLPYVIVDYIVQEFQTLPEIVKATPAELVKVNGVGEVRAEKIKEGLERIQEQLFIDRHM
ncbi:DNA integrity scanning diadenylate cyclase DisA [Saliterribacillus persicus]|uniref:DNA integrity scanning protein DisA n=1 Tax=Saliterribacillus persicus TaxID=930114 RepID=A0A368X9D2_9BACI|nr:DNA integrity scanning diadenylate cyclase DisA [Saliterribacillus persicus]RCW63598.1 diadenylate cyclase [Saliterribacillus persicus]